MDTVKIGKFIAELRREKNYTQEQLGEILSVTNKTISRWENGNYMPNIEMLQILSDEFSVSINELISGERFNDNDYKNNAEKNIASILNEKTFNYHDNYQYWKKKWIKENTLINVIIAIILLLIALLSFYLDYPMLIVMDSWLLTIHIILQRNKMAAYIERHIYDK